MKIHHLNCGTCCPVGGRLFDGVSDGPLGRIVCHCLLIESDSGLVLVDTGFGTRDIDHPHRRLSEFFLKLNNIQLRRQETALAQVRRLGFDPKDVRHILISHLDFDHAGGLEDFPHAAVHLLAKEKEVANEQRGGAFVGTRRYRPGQWDEVTDWRLYQAGEGERWFGFDAVRGLEGLPDDILLVPLAGHTWGHSGIAVRDDNGWLLHAADAYFYRGEIRSERYECTPMLRGYQRMMEVDRRARLHNLARLRDLSLRHRDEVRIICSHDAVEFDIMARQAVGNG